MFHTQCAKHSTTICRHSVQHRLRPSLLPAYQVKTLEGAVADSMFYDQGKYLEMEAQNKRMMHLLASAEEETEQTGADVARLKKALEVVVGPALPAAAAATATTSTSLVTIMAYGLLNSH